MLRQRKLCCVHKLCQCKVQKIAQFHNLCVLTCKKLAVAQPQRVYRPKLAKSHHAWKIQATLHNLGILKLPSVWIKHNFLRHHQLAVVVHHRQGGRKWSNLQTQFGLQTLEPDTPLNWSCFWLHWSALSLFCSRCWLHHSPKVSHRRLVLEIKAERLPALTL